MIVNKKVIVDRDCDESNEQAKINTKKRTFLKMFAFFNEKLINDKIQFFYYKKLDFLFDLR